MLQKTLLMGFVLISQSAQSTVYLSSSSHAQPINLSQPCVGMLYLEGPITSSRQFKHRLQYLMDHPLIKGIILAIDSGGGSATSAWEIFESLNRANKRKPIVSYIDEVCASGAYLAATATSQIVANPMGVIGSIGVVRTIEELEPEEFKRNGLKGKVKIHRFKKGKFKQLGNSYGPISPEDEQKLQESIDFLYEKFCSDVASKRNIPLEKIKAQESLTFMGTQAKEEGLIDQTGNLTDALRLLQLEMTGRGIIFPEDTDLMQSLMHV